jgi:hypothetical protein
MAHFKFNIDLWVEGETEEEAEERMESLFDFEPLGEVELIGWECVSKDMTESR